MLILNFVRLACLIVFKHELIVNLKDRITPEAEAEYQYLKNITTNISESIIAHKNYSSYNNSNNNISEIESAQSADNSSSVVQE